MYVMHTRLRKVLYWRIGGSNENVIFNNYNSSLGIIILVPISVTSYKFASASNASKQYITEYADQAMAILNKVLIRTQAITIFIKKERNC